MSCSSLKCHNYINFDSYNLVTCTYFSKYSNGNFLYPSPQTQSLEFIKSILDYVKKKRHQVLIPMHSEETYLLAKHRSKFLKHIKLPLHDYKIISSVDDKSKVIELAKKLNVPYPKTYSPSSIKEVKELAKYCEYPAIIKLRSTTSSVGLSYVNNRNELIEKYKRTVTQFKLPGKSYPIIQEYVPGEGHGVSLLFNQGELRAIFTHRRLREYPASGGPSTLRISIRHPKMEKYATALLKELSWHGVAMVEFKVHKKTKIPYLIEVNPRFWGSLNQAISAGVNFPYLLYNMCVDGDIKPVLNYKVGVVTRFFLNDIRTFKSYFKASKNKSELIKSYLKLKGIFYDDISIDDPLPFIVLALKNFKQIY